VELRFTAELWIWDARRDDSWYFVTLPHDHADAIDDAVGPDRRGFGSVRVEVTVGATTWRTSIFPDSKANSFVLPIKKAVRDRERLTMDAPVDVTVVVLDV
jgi:hypothetical protein